MAAQIGCVYGGHSSLTEKSGAFMRVSFEHSIFAMSVTAAAIVTLFSFNQDKVVSGLMNAAVATLSVNVVHLLSHQFWGEDADEQTVVKLVRLAGVFFFSVYRFPLIAENWGYQVSHQEAATFTMLSFAGIALGNYMRNEEEKLMAQVRR